MNLILISTSSKKDHHALDQQELEIKSECFQKEINHSKEQGYDFSGTHRTVDPRESNTLSIVDVLKSTADFAKNYMNAKTFLYKKVGLLSDTFSIYQS